MIEVGLQPDEGWGGGVDWAVLARDAVEAAVRASPQAELLTDDALIEIAIKLTDDAEVQALNAAYRGKNKPTNVLSFPMVQPDLMETVTQNSDDGEVLLGDVVLARGVCEREAEEKGVTVEVHTTHLIVHGTLHLLGHDHLDDSEAEAMESIERAALASLGISDPYAVAES